MRIKGIALVIFAVSIFIQLIFLLMLNKSVEKRSQSHDYGRFYEPVAENILLEKGIVDNSGSLASRYPPGYPVFLSALFSLGDLTGINRLKLIAAFNILLMSLGALLVYGIAGNILGVQTGFISSLLWITYPFNLWLIKQPNSEVLFIPLLYLSVYLLLVNSGKGNIFMALFSGVAVGVSALVRPVAVFFPFLIIGGMWMLDTIPKKKLALNCLMVLSGFLAVILPWEMKLYKTTGRVVLLSTGGVPSVLDGLTFATHAGAGGNRVVVPEDVMGIMKRTASKNDLETMGDIFKYMLCEMKQNPSGIFKLFVIKFCRSWYGTDEMWHEKYILLIQSVYVILAIAGLILGFEYYGDRRMYFIFLLGIILYFNIFATVVLSILRYMVPAMIAVIIFCAIVVNRIAGKLSSKICHVERLAKPLNAEILTPISRCQNDKIGLFKNLE